MKQDLERSLPGFGTTPVSSRKDEGKSRRTLMKTACFLTETRTRDLSNSANYSTLVVFARRAVGFVPGVVFPASLLMSHSGMQTLKFVPRCLQSSGIAGKPVFVSLPWRRATKWNRHGYRILNKMKRRHNSII
jgi:hypothetical protein